MSGEQKNPEPWKDAMVEEIFRAYREAGRLYRKTADPASRQMLLALQHGLDRMLQHLFPLGERSETQWDECRADFVD